MLDPPFAADGMMIAGAEEMMLVLLVDRQHVVPAPAPQAELAPVVVVGGLAAHIDHGVDRRRAADHLAARIVQRAAVEAGHRFGLEHPVGARIADREQVADRDMEPDPVVLAAGLEQQHAAFRIRRKTVRQHAACRARADNNVVVVAFERCRLSHVASVTLAEYFAFWAVREHCANAEAANFSGERSDPGIPLAAFRVPALAKNSFRQTDPNPLTVGCCILDNLLDSQPYDHKTKLLSVDDSGLP